MSKRGTDGIAIGALIVSAIVLCVLPVLRYGLLAKYLGMSDVGMLLLVEALVGVALGIHPLRSWSWYTHRDADDPALPSALVRHELVNAAVATLLLTVTAPAWPALFGVTAPAWMFVPIALRLAGLALVTTFLQRGHVIAIPVVILDGIIVLPLAILGRSLEAVVFAWTTFTLILTILVVYSPRVPRVAQLLEPRTRDRWRLGRWLRQLAKDLQHPVVVAVAGLGILVPLAASTALAGLMLAPFMAATSGEPSRAFVRRLARGAILTFLGWMFVHQWGPPLFRFLLPASFGDGSLMRTLAWAALAHLPLALFCTDERASERRMAIVGLASIALLAVFAAARGTDGCLWAIALAPVLAAATGLRRRSERVELL